MPEPVIYRDEVARLLFSVYDISETLTKILAVLVDEEESDDGQEEEG